MAGGMPPMMIGGGKRVGEFITDLDMSKYLNDVVTTQALKVVPIWQLPGIWGSSQGRKYGLGGSEQGRPTDESHDAIGDSQTTVAPHWYICYGASDRDTAFPVAVNLATKLQNAGEDVNFKLPWNRPHSGDYALNEFYAWIVVIVK